MLSLTAVHRSKSPGSVKPARVLALFKRGFTLIELLIVILISVMVAGAALTLYQINARTYVQQDALLEQIQNMRVALYTIARDIRMAGNCFAIIGGNVRTIQVYVPGPTGAGEWFKHTASSPRPGVRPIFGLDGAETGSGSDQLTIFRAEVESASPVGQLSPNYTPGGVGSDKFRLREPALENTVNDGDIVALVNGDTALILEVAKLESNRSDITVGDRFRPEKEMTGTTFAQFPAGSFVYNLRDVVFVTYYIDQNNKNLMADYHDGTIDDPDGDKNFAVIVATNIEDLQLTYFVNQTPAAPLSGDNSVSEGALDNGSIIRAVNVGLVSASRVRDDGAPWGPLSLFNHTPSGGRDGLKRRILTETVTLRNFKQ